MLDSYPCQTYSTLILSRQVQHTANSLQYRSIINEHKLLSPFQCGFRSNNSTELAATAFSDFIRVVWIKVYLLVLCLLTCAKRLILSITIY